MPKWGSHPSQFNPADSSRTLKEYAKTHSATFDKIGDHDDDVGVLIPDHLPEVVKCGVLRTLSRNKGSRTAEALKAKKGKRDKPD